PAANDDDVGDHLVVARTLTVDGRGLVSKEATPGQTVEYYRDPAGRVRQVRAANGDVLTQHEYTRMDGLETSIVAGTTYSVDSGKRVGANDALTTSVSSYDHLGNVTRITRPGQPAVEFKYDE